MKDFLDNMFIGFLSVMLLFVAYRVGVETTEAKYCRLNKGHYSFDYGECLK